MLKYHSKSSKIILYSGDTIYGCLFKNTQLSDIDLIKDELSSDKSDSDADDSDADDSDADDSDADSGVE
jgi:hypothetical protein